MKRAYRLTINNWDNGAVKREIIVHSLDEAWGICHGRLPRQRCGWAGMDGANEYILVRIS